MKKINDGIFSIEEEMLFKPQNLIHYEDMSDIFDERATREAADIVLHFSRYYGQWVAVSYPIIMKEIDRRYDEEKKSLGFIEDTEDWEREMKIYYKMSFLTCGIYALFFEKPQKPSGDDLNPCTLIYTLYVSDISKGLRSLVNKGFIDARANNDLPINNDILFFPNNRLLEKVMKPKVLIAESL
ncbi:MAG: hypothetical protein A3D35_01120 [Candidatus Staskawiczbacteria bacterium RIFCSPHIGHO2_02_FULL_34_9]|uniref:Uncharacterized protein n=1 Tax=Candidatus Staskawiczbacteria bacterium RIFCSPHIGHO2_02_FULL_34_9 TaxID=1802206 RepID=A0A1G2I1R4_9BACT|nr:MAG: hypothetical protein A3D35_01120 [Candidatus Staskawiczbacteria bacterium RIFCSPHIGHO2_02_FULL_34_9]